MQKVVKLFVASATVTTLVFGTSAYGIAEQNVAQAQETSGVDAKSQEPYYKYVEHTTYNSDFVLSSDFIQALTYDNVTMNGYKVNTPSEDAQVQYSKKVYETEAEFDKRDRLIYVKFGVQHGQIAKDDFKTEHSKYNKLISDEYIGGGHTHVTYQTQQGNYHAYFDENEHLESMRLKYIG